MKAPAHTCSLAFQEEQSISHRSRSALWWLRSTTLPFGRSFRSATGGHRAPQLRVARR